MTDTAKLSFSLNRKVTLLSLCVLPILLLLGNWQLQRAEEKREIAATLATRAQAGPVPLAALKGEAELGFRRVSLRGEYDSEKSILLDNRQRDGQVGYELLQPFRDQSGQWLLLNRGWLAAGPTRTELPALPAAPAGIVELEAHIYQPSAKAFLLGEQQLSQTFPQRILAVEVEKLAVVLERDLFPYELRIAANEPGALRTDWPGINMRPEQHTGYAVQWFAMALALCVWFVFANTNLWQVIRRKT